MSATITPIYSRVHFPPVGEEREAGLRALRLALAPVAEWAVCTAFSSLCRLPAVRGVDLNDIVPLFVEAMRKELDKAGVS